MPWMFGSYMIYNIAVIFVLSYLGTYEHVDHYFYIHLNIYDAMLQLFIIIHVITMRSLFFRIKLCRKLSKSLTIQKPNFKQFFLSGFAAALKPNQFDEKEFHDLTCTDEIMAHCDELLLRCTWAA
jgi:hypothetical protein